jgi:hypothetical protein
MRATIMLAEIFILKIEAMLRELGISPRSPNRDARVVPISTVPLATFVPIIRRAAHRSTVVALRSWPTINARRQRRG